MPEETITAIFAVIVSVMVLELRTPDRNSGLVRG
jgi:uncharacterized membrane protein